MALIIHCRLKDGKSVFRVWSSTSDQYVTEELTEEGVRQELLQEEVRRTIESFFTENPKEINRAKETGTSSRLEDAHDLNGPWEEEVGKEEGGNQE